MKDLALGDRAPEFTLPDEHGASVSLSDFHGKKNVLLIFYPGDMTPGCTVQLCAVRDDWTKFVTANTMVLGINHGDAESHTIFKSKYKFPFPLLTDKTKKISEAYGAVRSILKLKLIKRSVIGIDKNGTVVYVKRGMPKNSDILKAVTTLK